MSNSVFARLAAGNLKKNASSYIPYLITSVMTVAMFYIMVYLTTDPWVTKNSVLGTLMVFGSIIIAIFAVIFLFYTNSFLIKRRKKEFGLYNVLGMEKRHICRVMAFENIVVAVLSIAFGLFFGILFSKLTMLLLTKLLRFNGGISFEISITAIIVSTLLFAFIFLLTLLFDFVQIGKANPVELLHGGNVGEREPKTKLILSIAGILMLGGGYFIAVMVKDPLQAVGLFFVAVILVVLGTYCLFVAVGIAILKLMRKNKKYYYKAKNFISVSGMLYRMKKNAVGLANVCILSTMVLVMVSTTSCLFIGSEDALRTQYPRNIIFNTWDIDSANDGEIIADVIESVSAEEGFEIKNVIAYRYSNFAMIKDGNSYSFRDNGYYDSNVIRTHFIPLSDYNKIQGTSETLGDDEIIYASLNIKPESDIITISGKSFKIKQVAESLNIPEYSKDSMSGISEQCYFVLADEYEPTWLFNIAYENNEFEKYDYYYGFDIDESDERQIELAQAITDKLNASKDLHYGGFRYNSVVEAREQFYSMYGGLFFLCIILGLLFLTVTVLIIYYKQVSEGYEDKERFRIMQKVGMSREEIRHSIRSQVLTVFFLPLAVSIIHVLFAFPLITKVLAVLGLVNIQLFVICTIVTIGVFAVFYSAIYILTAKTYYRIVE